MEVLPGQGTKFGDCQSATHVASPIRTPIDEANSGLLSGRAANASWVDASATMSESATAAPLTPSVWPETATRPMARTGHIHRESGPRSGLPAAVSALRSVTLEALGSPVVPEPGAPFDTGSLTKPVFQHMRVPRPRLAAAYTLARPRPMLMITLVQAVLT